MSSAQLVRLEQVANIVQGGRLKMSGRDDFVPEGVPAYGAGGMNGYVSVAEFDVPAVILSSIGARCGKCFYVEGEWTSLANTQLIFPDPERVDPRFLWYQLNDELSWHRSGTGQPFIKPSDVKRRTVNLPPLPEQRRIAEILDRADALRAKRREAITKLDSLTQSIFIDMFGDSSAELELGEVITFVTSGGRGWAQYYSKSGSRFIRSLDVRMNRLSDDEIAYIDPPDNAEARRTRVMPGDLLLTITGSRIGRVAWVDEAWANAYISQHVALLRLDQNRLRSPFASQFLSLDQGGQRQIQRLQYGQTKPGLNFNQIRSIRIPAPNVADQDRYLNRLGVIQQVRTSANTSLQQLDALFASLQHRSFSGLL